MSYFSIRIPKIKETSVEFEDMAKKMSVLEKRFCQVASEINQNEGYGALKDALAAIASELASNTESLEKLSDVTKQVIEIYQSTEKNITNAEKGKEASDSKTAEEELSEEEYIQAMATCYGFSEEEAQLIMDAFKAFEGSEQAEGLSKKEKINVFFSNMASLVAGYSGDDKKFAMMGDNPTQEEAVKFFYDLGVDGNKLKDAINDQHNDCEEYRDFAHECAIYSVMANSNVIKGAAGIVDYVDDLVGYKGDIYSGSMGDDDIKGDIAAVNLYNRMINSEGEDLFDVFTEYNNGCVDGTINESIEFLEYYGDGDAKVGMQELKDRIEGTSIGTKILDDGVSEKDIEDCKKRFLEHLSIESGVSIPCEN